MGRNCFRSFVTTNMQHNLGYSLIRMRGRVCRVSSPNDGRILAIAIPTRQSRTDRDNSATYIDSILRCFKQRIRRLLSVPSTITRHCHRATATSFRPRKLLSKRTYNEMGDAPSSKHGSIGLHGLTGNGRDSQRRWAPIEFV
jgi:hypothetical protein